MNLAEELFTLPFGLSSLERASELRKDGRQLRAMWNRASSRVLVMSGTDRVPLASGGGLFWTQSAECGPWRDDRIFLGVDASRRALFATKEGSCSSPIHSSRSLREVALELDALDQSAAVLAVALMNWHERSRFCTYCGSKSRIADAGHLRVCDDCHEVTFPRSDAAVIMLVTSGDQCVLGRRIGSATDRWSTLAGFVEPGESPESAVGREVREEVGLIVDRLRYKGGQPWPFPSSLMLAYEAHATYGELEINEEHHEVRWFHRKELSAGIDSGTMAVPSKLSAGGHLITNWLAGDGGMWPGVTERSAEC